ncbi:hypothetical protein BD310DRAFT_265809 [Dichomitus squalens]|uniref:Uncharacterized protein n=1 Tax=Dichomitus squalens TaxID=114155 RepID=A0A4Q9Q136_9APHY|nr:hypothetical protein BD310DRAFT_265809 [Dichomitus squalens]
MSSKITVICRRARMLILLVSPRWFRSPVPQVWRSRLFRPAAFLPPMGHGSARCHLLVSALACASLYQHLNCFLLPRCVATLLARLPSLPGFPRTIVPLPRIVLMKHLPCMMSDHTNARRVAW